MSGRDSKNLAGLRWGADTLISMPEPVTPGQPVLKSFGALGMTIYGWQHDFNEAQHEMLVTPFFGPPPGAM